jgi:hypothetical protein
MLRSQTVLIKAEISKGKIETLKVPRYFLDKCFNIFEDSLRAHDLHDPLRQSNIVIMNLAGWYNTRGLHHLQTEWNMLQIFFKWLLCGRIVGEPDYDVPCISWGERCPVAFANAISHRINDRGIRSERGISPSLSDISSIEPI